LELVKIHTETTILLDKRSWEERDDPVPPTAAISMIHEKKINLAEEFKFGESFSGTSKNDRRFQKP
jgi:hypothetical protein